MHTVSCDNAWAFPTESLGIQPGELASLGGSTACTGIPLFAGAAWCAVQPILETALVIRNGGNRLHGPGALALVFVEYIARVALDALEQA